ncbi:MAG TPA: dsRBD fold-containing protein [Micromonosporaceae bacterium]|jgi:hypothetical protein|nr:dsRBD fold-containing protein [Micromonosporaceae bacterium]
MATVKRWTVDIYIDEHAEERRTYAEARLRTGDDTHLAGTGTALRNPSDREVPEVGDELAAARALADLSRRLQATATDDIESLTVERGAHGW